MRFNLACPRCGGTGQVRSICRTCGGEGRVRRAETIDVRIPAGVQTGSRVRVPGHGNAGTHGAPAGDLYIVTEVQPHPYFERRGDDLYTVVPITVTEAALGAKIEVPTLDGRSLLRVPPGTNSGQKLRLREKGVPFGAATGQARRSVRRIASGRAQARGRARAQSAARTRQTRARRSAPRPFRARHRLSRRKRRAAMPTRSPRKKSRAGYMISAVADLYKLHPQTLRLYERVGLLKPSRSEGNTRLYTDADLERLEVILTLTREMGVNLAGIEIILNMREKMAEMQRQMEEFTHFVQHELSRGLRSAQPETAPATLSSASRSQK